MIPTHVNSKNLISAPIDAIWEVIRDFNSFPIWHPYVKSSEIHPGGRGDAVGSKRTFVQMNDNKVTEQLIALDDDQHMIKYLVIESALPVENYLSTIQLTPVANTLQTIMSWEVDYLCDPSAAEELNHELDQVFMSGIDNLNKMLGQALEVEGQE